MGTEEGTGGYGVMSSNHQDQNLHTFEPVQYKDPNQAAGTTDKNDEGLLKTYGALSFSQRAPSEERSRFQNDQ